MTAENGVSAPRPWYKKWWGIVVLILFWPFSLTYYFIHKSWKLFPKLAAIGAVWILFVSFTSNNKTTSTPPPVVQGIQTSVNIVPTINVSTASAVKPLVILTSTPKPILVPTKAIQTGSSEVKYYTNTDGIKVQSPIQSDTKPAGASAKCRDGSYSFSLHRSGTCSGHGGVAQWY
jgi:hypothetical protein